MLNRYAPALVALFLSACASSDAPTPTPPPAPAAPGAYLVGTWTLTGYYFAFLPSTTLSSGPVPAGATLRFSADGSYRLTDPRQTMGPQDGTYTATDSTYELTVPGTPPAHYSVRSHSATRLVSVYRTAPVPGGFVQLIEYSR